MKRIILILLLFLLYVGGQSQTLTPKVIPTNGGSATVTGGSVSWTIGETVTATLTSGTNVLSQGEQQPEVDIITGTITGSPFCAGTSVSVPYTADGYYGGANVFTAQLSDGSGSFVNPINIGNVTASTSGTISATIPSNTASGTGYRIRVVSNVPNYIIGTANGVNITVYPTSVVTSIGSNSPLCAGSALHLTSVSSGYSTRVWSGPDSFSNTGANPSITNTIVNESGTYTLTETTSLGCVSSVTTVVVINPLPTPVITGPSSFCTGGSVTLNANAGYSSYSWNHSGGTNQAAVFTTAGTFVVTVTDGNACSATASQVVTVNALPDPDILPSTAVAICIGGSTSIDAGAGFATYIWSNGASTEIITISPASTTTYSVTVTNGNNCSKSSSKVVTINPLPLSAIDGITAICSGNSTHISADPNGDVYLWNTGATTGSITISPVVNTTYSVTVTKASTGCSATASQLITVNPSPTVSTTITPITCHGLTNGQIVATPSSGTSPYSYLWNNANTTSGISNLAAGNYHVTITDANSCTVTSIAAIPTAPTNVTFTHSQTNVTCNGASNGTITISAAGGTSPYQYSDDNGNNYFSSNSFTGLPGTIIYPIYVQDANNCLSGLTNITISNPSPISINNVTVTSAASCSGTYGSITISASGGTGTLAYSDNGGQTFPYTHIISVMPNQYSIQVTDANNCLSSIVSTVVNGTGANITVTSVAPTNSGSCLNGSITINPVGTPALPLFLSVNGGTSGITLNSTAPHTFSSLAAGAYKPEIIDANYCLYKRSPVTLTLTCVNSREEEQSISDSSSLFVVYPNPADAFVNISFKTMEEGTYNIKLVDMIGRVIKTDIDYATPGNNTHIMNLDNIASGVYVVILQNNKENLQKKIVVQ